MRCLQVSARVILALWLAIAPVYAGSMTLLGAGKAGAAAFQGPLDIFTTSPFAAYSCSRALKASNAIGSYAACEVQRTSDSTKCIIIIGTSGFADIATANCSGNTQTLVQFCNATTCGIDSATDQTGNGRDAIQATQINQPTLTLSSTPKGTLPAINCSGGTNGVLQTASSFTLAQPITLSFVGFRTGGVGAIGASSGAYLGSGPSTNQAQVNGGTSLAATVTDSTWNAISGLANGNGTSSVININGVDTTGAAGTNGLATVTVRVCRAGGNNYFGLLAEAIIWGAVSSPTDRANISANQHGTNGYNF